MRYELAHLQGKTVEGKTVNFVVFNAKPINNTASARDELLAALMLAARRAKLNVEAGGLIYEENGQLQCWGDNFTRSWIENNGIPSFNKTLDVS